MQAIVDAGACTTFSKRERIRSGSFIGSASSGAIRVVAEPMNDPERIRGRFEKVVQAIVDAGACPAQPTTVVDLSGPAPVLVRLGRGDPALLGLSADEAA